MTKSVGRTVAAFLDLFPCMESWKSSQPVWDFQERFGVRKRQVIERKKGAPYEVRMSHF